MKSHTLPIAMTLMIGVFNCAYAQEAVKSPIPQVNAECSDFGPSSASTASTPSGATTTRTSPSNETSPNTPVKIERTGMDKASIHLQILQQTSNHLSETNTKKVNAEEKKAPFKTEKTEEPSVQE
jgi:hypothetical protein